jgi:hypothetical protein
MLIVHVVLAILYVGGMILLRPLLRQRLPTPSSRFVAPIYRPWIAFVWLWDPVLWFLPGILWARVFDGFSTARALSLSLLLPLSYLLVYFWCCGLFAFSSPSSVAMKLLSGSLAGSVILVTLLVTLTSVSEHGISWTQLWVFVATCLWGPLLLTVLLAQWSWKVVPLPEGIRGVAGQAIKMILGYYTSSPKPTWFVENGQLRTRIEGNPLSGSGPGCLVTEPENAVLLKTTTDVMQVAGPGVTLTEAMVSPAQVVDLRNQVRKTTVNAVTRDGIEVSVPVSTLFRVDRGPKKVTLRKPWPYRNVRSVFHALLGAEVDSSGQSSLGFRAANPWEDRVLAVAAHKAKQVIAFYSLDQLYGPPFANLGSVHESLQKSLGLSPVVRPADPLLRSTAGKFVQRAVRQAFEREGLEILGGGIGNRITPLHREVTDQRVIKWKSAFVAKMMDWQIMLRQKRFQELNVRQSARGLAVEEVVTHTSDRLAKLSWATQESIRAYEVLYTLVSVAQTPEVRKMLPDSAVPTLTKLMRQATGEELEDGAT